MDLFLQSLRSRTAHQHSLLEQNSASINLLCQKVTAHDYSTYLAFLYGFVKGFEKNVFPLLQNNITDIEERRKTHLLHNDLHNLGVNEEDIAVISDDFFAQVYKSKAAALGGMYVLEGSVLGGAFILKHLQKTLGIEAIAGKATYFTAYGPQTGSRWKNFLQEFCSQSSGIEDQVINSASQTFNILHHWFNNIPIKLIDNES